MAKLRTTIEISTGGWDEYDVPVEVEYTFRAGCSSTYERPGEADTVTLNKITVIEANGDTYGADWLVTLLEDDDELLALCAQDWLDCQSAAEEYRAEARREEALLAKGGAQ